MLSHCDHTFRLLSQWSTLRSYHAFPMIWPCILHDLAMLQCTGQPLCPCRLQWLCRSMVRVLTVWASSGGFDALSAQAGQQRQQ